MSGDSGLPSPPPLLDRKCWEQASFLHSSAHSAPHIGKFSPSVLWLTLIRSLGNGTFPLFAGYLPVDSATFPLVTAGPSANLMCLYSVPRRLFQGTTASHSLKAIERYVHHAWFQLHIPCLSDFPVILPLPWESYSSFQYCPMTWFGYRYQMVCQRGMP